MNKFQDTSVPTTNCCTQSNTSIRIVAIAVLLAVAALYGVGARAQSCPAYVPSGSTCVPIHLSEKEYWSQYTGPAGPVGPFATEAAVIEHIRSSILGGRTYCSITGGSTSDIAPGPGEGEISFGGIMLQDYWRYSFTVVWPDEAYPDPETCEHTLSQDFPMDYYWWREATCPDGFDLTQSMSGTQPTCSRPPTRQDKEKNLGACPVPSSPGAPDQPGPCPYTGNPISTATQNKFQTETDYVGAGTFPLRFARYYNSRASSPGGTQPAASLGLGWSATYFQSLAFAIDAGLTYVIAHRPDGRIVRFSGSGSSFVAEADVIERLAPTSLPGGGNGWRLTNGDGSTETFNATGQLLSIRARHGETHSLQYGSSSLPESVSDDFGHTLNFEYDSSSGTARLSSVVDPAGHHIDFNTSTNLVSVTYQDGATRQYLYREGDPEPHLLVGIVDENTTRYSYYEYGSDDGYVLSTSLAGGVDSFALGNVGANQVSVTEPLGNERGLSLNTVRGVTRVSATGDYCPWCRSSGSFIYDANGNVSSRIDPNGITTNYAYDLSRNLETSRTEAAGTPRARTITTQWHPTYRLPTLITEPRRKTSFTHDATGNVLTRTITDTTVTPNVTRTWTYTYDAWGHVLTEDRPRTDVADVTTYAFYNCFSGVQCGQLNTITDAAGHTTTYASYDAHGKPLSIVDANGLVTTLTYDLRSRLTSRTTGSETTTYEYWPTCLLKKVTLPDGSDVQYTYDDAHRLVEMADSAGNRIVYTLDAAGNRTNEQRYDGSGALSRSQNQTFTQMSRLWQSISSVASGSQVTEFSYDSAGNEIGRTDALAHIMSKTYDELNRVSQVTDPALGVTKYAYDSLNNTTSVTDPRNRVTTYTYSGFSDLTKVVSPDTGTTTTTYDAGGNVQTRKDARNLTSTYAYDALNRITSIDFGDQLLTYSYDTGANASGRLVSTSDSNQSESWTYDSHGRVASLTQTVGSVSKSISYSYTDSRLTSVTTPSGQVVAFTYADGQLTTVAVNGVTVLSGAIREPFGPIRQWTWGNGTLAARTFDQDWHLTQLDGGGEAYSYGYDEVGRLTSKSNLSSPALSWTYDYDDLDELVGAQKSGTTFGWTYDANGNRLTQSGSGATTFVVATTNNRLTSTSGALARTYTYDAAGNTKTFSNRTFTFDNRGRLNSAKVGTATTNYVYNARGYRVKKAGAITRLFMYDERGYLVGEYDGSGGLIQEIVWLDDTPVATLRPKAGGGVDVFYIHSDNVNAPRSITRPTDNAVVWRWDADPFGQVSANENPSGLGTFAYNLRFPGQYYDSETGLHYNSRRDYDPATGRYLQSDPIGLNAGTNTYAYVSGNPISNIDPSGLIKWKGEMYVVLASGVLGGAQYVFDLRSECVDGQYAYVHVYTSAIVTGLGAKVTGGGSAIEFEDSNLSIDPYVFEGPFRFFSAGAGIGLTYGWAYIQLGEAFATPSWKPEPSIGFDASIAAAIFGRSAVFWPETKSCACHR